MKELWGKKQETQFFTEARKFATPEQLFYISDDNRYFAYWPRSYKGTKSTLQSRNTLIGDYTERWTADLLSDFAQSKGYYAVNGVVCDVIGLSKGSPADVAICRTKSIHQKPEDILLLIEVKMSVVWNWELERKSGSEEFICLGDYRTHQGNPGLLRSDTMLKAIGKSINVRISNVMASKIPIVILGNTPIAISYYEKVDHLITSGIIQGFWSVNPSPSDSNVNNIKNTSKQGFWRIDSYNELLSKLNGLLVGDREFFSSMRTEDELGKFIEIANKEASYEKKAEKFLSLIRE